MSRTPERSFSTERTVAQQPHQPRPWLWLVVAAAVLITLYAGWLAIGQWDRLVPGVVTDPFGRITNFGWPSWNGYQRSLSMPLAITSINGRPIPEPRLQGPYPAAEVDRIVEEAGQRAELHLSMEGMRRHTEVTVRVEKLGWVPWLVLFGGFVLLAWIWLCAAGFSYYLRPDSKSVRAFTRWCVLNALILLTIFDYHTTRQLVPLYLMSYALLPVSLLELGMRFPDDIEILRAHPSLIWVLRGLAPVALVLLFVAAFMGHSKLLVLGTSSLGVAVVILAVQMGTRWALAKGRRRTQLLLFLIMWMPITVATAMMVLIMPESRGPYFYILLFPLTVLGIMGLTYAMIRYDLWDSRVMVRRHVLRPLLTTVLGVSSGLVAAILFLSIEDVGARGVQVLLAFVLVSVAVPLLGRFDHWIDDLLFPADAFYRPTVEQLSLRFTDLTSRRAVGEAVESTVRQWLPCERVRFVPLLAPVPDRADESGDTNRSLPPVAAAMVAAMKSGHGGVSFNGANSAVSNIGSLMSLSGQAEPEELRALRRAARKAGIEGIGTEQAAILCRGEVVHPSLTMSSRFIWAQLVIPARFREQVVGLLAVSPKRQAQLFTSEDENLLCTIANQAALALACANAYEQVESLQKAQQAAFREEKGAALGTVAAEIAHEIRFPINFFRMLLESYQTWLKEGKPPEGEDVEIGREEVERLERMAGNLRRIATTRTLDRSAIELRPLCDHVRLLLRDRLQGRFMDVDVDALIDVIGDRDALMQILVNLIANALDACPAPGGVGVSSSVQDDGRLRLVVWDAGPGFAADVGKIFQPWYTTKKTGSGLGLPITRRLVRAHGWEIGASRRGDRTCFEVVIPLEEWHRRPPPVEESQFDSGPIK